MDVVEEKQQSSSKASMDIGALLVEARENKNLTAQDIADEMNLTLSVISKIESNEFKQDIPLAFIRGYVRSYAQKVGVDVETICVEFDRQTGGSIEPVQNLKVVSDFKIRRREINSSSFVFKIVTFLIIISLVAFAGWELWKRLSNGDSNNTEVTNAIELNTESDVSAADSIGSSLNDDSQSIALSTETQTAESQTPQSFESQNSVQPSSSSALASTENSEIEQAPQQATNVMNESTSAVANNTEDGSSVVNEAVVSKPLMTGPVKQVEFVFSNDCWVQVSDANGEVIAVGIKKQGYVMPLEGVVPFDVILGEPTAVTIKVDGVGFDLSGYRAGRRAQFIIE